MAKSRKTVSVEYLIDKVNHYLRHSSDDKQGERQGALNLLEIVLVETVNYRGFGYLNHRDMETSESGMSVGIHEDNVEGEKFQDTDHTRVHYYK